MVVSVADRTYLEVIARLDEAPRAERAAIIASTARSLGVTVQTAYRKLREHGWASGRKPRRDRGATTVDTEELVRLAAIVATGRSKRGRANIPVKLATNIARKTGDLSADVSYGHLCRKLRQAGLSRRHMSAPEASVPRRSKHPNHVWFFDISVAIQWYFRDPETGKRLDLYPDAQARFYEGKRMDAARKVIHRFAVTDHTTGAYFIRYYYSAGESAEDIVDFLFRAMSWKPAVGDAFPFRGVPRWLVMDQGPGNKSALVKNLLEGLNVKAQYHRARNAKASGSVETRHRHWQESFEAKLSLRPARDLEEINTFAERECALLNSEKDHTRLGRPPMSAWVEITPEQLVEAPTRDAFLELAHTNAKVGTLTNELYLRAKNQWWQIGGELVFPGQKVRYRLTPFAESGIRVTDEQDRPMTALRITKDRYGFPTNGHHHGWDDPEAKGATAPTTPAQRVRDAVTEGTGRVRVEDVFDDQTERLARFHYLNRPGATTAGPTTPSRFDVVESVEVRDDVIRRLGRGLTREEGRWWKERIGDGIPRSDVDRLYTEFLTLGGSSKEAAQ